MCVNKVSLVLLGHLFAKSSVADSLVINTIQFKPRQSQVAGPSLNIADCVEV